MEFCEENIECLGGSSKTKESCDLNFFKTWNCSLSVVFMLLSVVEDRREFTLDYSLLLSLVIQLSI